MSKMWEASKQIYRENGVKSFYDGNLTNCLKVIPESALKFIFYRKMLKFFVEKKEDCNFFH